MNRADRYGSSKHRTSTFIVLLTPSALEGCGDSADWLRREIEAALDNQRHIVRLMANRSKA